MEAEKRRKNMQKIKSKDTSIEVSLRKALWKKGYRYRKCYEAADRTSYSQNIKLRFSAMVNFFMEKTGKFCDLD